MLIATDSRINAPDPWPVTDLFGLIDIGNIQVLKVLAPGVRRGPPPEARQLYELLSGPPGAAPAEPRASGERAPGAGRPSKRDRRLIDRLGEDE